MTKQSPGQESQKKKAESDMHECVYFLHETDYETFAASFENQQALNKAMEKAMDKCKRLIGASDEH